MTIYELAKALNVTPATVSKALHGTGRMKAETRERIMAYAREVNYQPSAVAANLRQSRTHTIGVIVPFIGNGVFSAIVSQAERAAAERDYNIILITTGAELEREQNAVGMLLRRRVEGVIAVPYGSRRDLTCPHFARLTENGIPVVMAEQDMPGSEFPKVLIDNRDGARQLTSHLLEAGHRRIMLAVHSTEPWNRTGGERVAGYRDAYRKAGLEAPEELIITRERLFKSDLVKRIRREKITAIFAICDALAIDLIAALSAAGLNVPEDVSVAGFDNLDYTASYLPALTTVNQPMEALGERAAAQLFAMIEAGKPDMFNGQTASLPCQLVVRRSCRKV